MIHHIVNNPDIGWNHPDNIWLASKIVSDFGRILKKNGWMIYGAPESLLPTSKENVKIAFEILLNFFRNKHEWDNFRNKYPGAADSIISNSFYTVMIKGYSYVETFIPDEEAKICVEVAGLFKDKESDELYDFLRDKGQWEKFSHTQKIIKDNIKEWQNYLNSQELFIKDDILD